MSNKSMGILIADISPCPCGSGELYSACCQRWHAGVAAPTAEVLMRSRYSAYVFSLEDYLLATWHPDTRPKALALAADATRWLGLKIVRSTSGAGIDEDVASVEFVARFRNGGGAAQRLHELSRFVRQDARWYYLDGAVPIR